MIRPEMKVFIQFPDETVRRVLHPGEAIDVVEGVVVRPEPGVPPIDGGDELLIYYELDREFVKQAARVFEVIENPEDPQSQPTIKFELIGGPVSAESRQCYRVLTALCNLEADVGENQDCQLVDASITGFGVIARPGLKTGSNLPVTLNYDDRTYSGSACLQSIKVLDNNRTRYGFSSNDSEESELANGLRAISLGVQRQQLRRLSGAA